MLNIVFIDDLQRVLSSQTESFFLALESLGVDVNVDDCTFTLKSKDDEFRFKVNSNRIVLGKDFPHKSVDEQDAYFVANLILPEDKTLFVIDLCLDEESEMLETGFLAGKYISNNKKYHYDVLYTSANAQYFEPENSDQNLISKFNYAPRARKQDDTLDDNFPADKISHLYYWERPAVFDDPVKSIIDSLLMSRKMNEQLFGAIVSKAMELAYDK